MEMSNRRKALYITIAILLSFLIWFYLNNSQDVEVSINDIPVEFLNTESALANKGLVLMSGGDATLNLVLSMPRSMVYDFEPERVRAVADLNSVNSRGTQTLTCRLVYPTNVNTSQISVRSPSVLTVSVRVGELFRRDDVEIRCKLVGNVADGYVAGSVQLLPEVLSIWGQQSEVMQVSYAQVTLNIENARSTIMEMLEYELYDENDQLIENSNIRSANSTIQVTMPVIAATDIPLHVTFVEEPGVKLSSFDVSMDIESVTLSGDANEIAALEQIELGEVVLSEIEGEEQIVFDIEIPSGLRNLSGEKTATLTIKNRDVETKEINVTRFEYQNFSAEDKVVEVVTSSLPVTLRGARETLEAITASSVTAVADLSGVTDASGTYTVPAVLQIEGAPDVGTVEAYELTARISAESVPEDTAEETDEEEATTAGENAEGSAEEEQPAEQNEP